MVTYLPRSAWNARPARGSTGLVPAAVDGTGIHWPGMAKPINAAGATGQARVASALRGWQSYHMDGRGWSDIAYQVAVDQAGRAWTLRGLNIRSGANGDADVNRRYGAILLILAPGEKPSAAMIGTVRGVIGDFRRRYPAGTQIKGHGQIRPEPTSCPGPAAQAAINRGDFTPRPTPSPAPRPTPRPAPIVEELDMATATEIKTQLDRMEKKFDGFVLLESGRYKVDSDRYGEFHDKLNEILDDLAADPASPLTKIGG
jgi:hypothetical protein